MSLKEYEFLKLLENRGICSILKIKNKRDGQIYILKNILFYLLDKKEKQNAINEIKILKILKHPNILEFKNAFIDKATRSLNILMEYPNKGSLENKINFALKNEGHLEESIIWNIFSQIVKGINYAHKKGIIHKNLNSKNIYLTKMRMVKIGNFGGKIAFNKMNMIFSDLKELSYCAPEIWNHQKLNNKCDIWSLGCIIYEMANLFLPFKGKNSKELYNSIILGKFNSIPNYYSNNLKYIIRSMLILNPSKRPSAEQLLDFINIKQIAKNYDFKYVNEIIKPKNLTTKGSIKNLNSSLKGKKNILKNRTNLNSRNILLLESLPKNNKFIQTEDINNASKNKIEKKIKNSTYRTLKERAYFANIELSKNNSNKLLSLKKYNFDSYIKTCPNDSNSKNKFNNKIKSFLRNQSKEINNNNQIRYNSLSYYDLNINSLLKNKPKILYKIKRNDIINNNSNNNKVYKNNLTLNLTSKTIVNKNSNNYVCNNNNSIRLNRISTSQNHENNNYYHKVKKGPILNNNYFIIQKGNSENNFSFSKNINFNSKFPFQINNLNKKINNILNQNIIQKNNKSKLDNIKLNSTISHNNNDLNKKIINPFFQNKKLNYSSNKCMNNSENRNSQKKSNKLNFFEINQISTPTSQ